MQLFKIVGTIIVLFLVASFFMRNLSKKPRRSLIPWDQNNKLKWTDFRGKVTKDFKDVALTGTVYDYHERMVGDSVEIYMVNLFLADSSCVRKELASDDVLDHEQRHFDVAEIYVRRLRAYIHTWQGSTKNEYNDYLLAGVDSVYRDSLAYHYEYQTNHGSNKRYQRLWDKKIDSLLRVYDAFRKNIFKMYWPSSKKDFDNNLYETYMSTRRQHDHTIDTRE